MRSSLPQLDQLVDVIPLGAVVSFVVRSRQLVFVVASSAAVASVEPEPLP